MSQVWLVTGSTSGIGKETVKAALAAGHKVVATGRNTQKLDSAFADAQGDNLACVELDVVDEAQGKAAVATAVERFGRLDVLVNNAGNTIIGHFEDLTNADFAKQFAGNFYGVLNLMRAALPVMRQQKSGHIINVSSVAGVIGFPHCAAYSGSKFALEGASLAVAQEVAGFGIKMTVVEPGFFRTELLASHHVDYAASNIDDYAEAGNPADTWEQYNGAQGGDPAKLGEVLVKLAGMDEPPQIFAAGSDALEMITPTVEARLAGLKAHTALSQSTDGNF